MPLTITGGIKSFGNGECKDKRHRERIQSVSKFVLLLCY